MPVRFLDIAGIFTARICLTLMSRHITKQDIFMLRQVSALHKITRAEVDKHLSEVGKPKPTPGVPVPTFQICWPSKELRRCDVHWIVLRCASKFRECPEFHGKVSRLQVSTVIEHELNSVYNKYTLGSTKPETICYVVVGIVRGLKSVCSKIRLNVADDENPEFDKKAILRAIWRCVLFRNIAGKMLKNKILIEKL